MSNVIPLDKLVITRVKTNWYMARIHGAAFFSRSRSEVFLKYRRWALLQDSFKQHSNIVAIGARNAARA